MMALTFQELLAQPPLKQTTVTLPDGRDITLHELPVSVLEQVQRVGQQKEDGVSHLMHNVTRVVAHALTGRPPTEEEVQDVMETFGASAVMFIYYEALKFSRLGPDALDETKKH